MASEIRVNTINNSSGLGTITISDTGHVFSGITTIASVTIDGGTVTGNLTGTASTATASATAYGLSGSPTLTGITSVSTTNLTVNGNAYPAAGPLSNRNLIINGAMQVAQRGTQVTSVTNSGYRTVDRFQPIFSNLGTWTVDQSTDSPNGFSNSLKVTCTTADASPAAGDYAFIRQNIEAQNLQSLGYGTADAKAMTLSFWVKSNKTGSASLDSRQVDNSVKLWSATYSISSADTWEYKTVTIPGDTAGVIDNDTGAGLYIDWWFNSGSNFTGGSVASTWSTNDETRRNPSNLGVGGATSDYFAITGVQLEVGQVATPFEHRSFGDELARCKRYYEKSYPQGTDPGSVYGVAGTAYVSRTNLYRTFEPFTVEKRGTPSVVIYSPDTGTADKIRNVSSDADVAAVTDAHSPIGVRIGSNSGGDGDLLRWHWTADAEL